MTLLCNFREDDVAASWIFEFEANCSGETDAALDLIFRSLISVADPVTCDAFFCKSFDHKVPKSHLFFKRENKGKERTKKEG